MVGAYIDESSDERAERVFSLAAYVARTEEWVYEFEPRWSAKLHEHEIEYFRATDCESGTGPFSKFRTASFPDPLSEEDKVRLRDIKTDFVSLAISQEYMWGFGVNVIIEDFKSLINVNPDAKRVLTEDPFVVAFQVLFTRIGLDAKKFNDSQPSGFRRHMVAFILDDRKEIRYRASEAYDYFQEKTPRASEWAASLTFANDRKVLELQAADNLAFEIRKNCLNDLMGSPRKERKALQRLKDKLAIVYRLDRRSLESLVRYDLDISSIRSREV